MGNKQKVAFIKIGDFSHINERIIQILTNHFPDFQVDVIDIFPDLLKKKDLKALFFCLKDYGWDILLRKRNIYDSFLRTPYSFGRIKQAVIDRIADKGYSFTFQTQSMFDASVPGTPNFLYTDHTHLANLLYPGYNKNHLYTRKWIDCEKSIYQNATLNFTMSSNIVDSIVNDYSCKPERVKCVYCGANVKVEENEIFSETRFLKNNILFVGLDWQRKGGPVLVEAFKIVLAKYPDATLTIVGSSPKLNIPNCNIVGRVQLSDVKKYFEQTSVFCLPTTIEPFGIVFLEAMAHQLPLIGTKIGAIPDFIHEDKNGYLIEPNNSQQLAQNIIKLFDSPELCKSFGEYSQKLYRDKYTWDKTGERITDSIKACLGLSR